MRIAMGVACVLGVLLLGLGGVQGRKRSQKRRCFVLYDLKKNRWHHISNLQECQQPLPPCSTFKIPHTLLALQTGKATTHTRFRWDGKKRFLKRWNRDHNLASAMNDSVVWVYQRIARKIGRPAMKVWLKKLKYGNQEVKGPLHRFWLKEDALKITAMQQIHFLRKLLKNRLPLRRKVMKTGRSLVPAIRGKGWVVRGKTGSLLSRGKLRLGWYVGWVTSSKGRFVFASHLRAPGGAWGSRARRYTMKRLKALKLLH
jgi:beta-lactamase class D